MDNYWVEAREGAVEKDPLGIIFLQQNGFKAKTD